MSDLIHPRYELGRAAALDRGGTFVSGAHYAIIDPGPESTYATLREHLHSRGLSAAQLDAVLLTHIHLDHAGASGSLVRDNSAAGRLRTQPWSAAHD